MKDEIECAVCKQPSAVKIDWWDQNDCARTARIHATCEEVFFSEWFRYREPHRDGV